MKIEIKNISKARGSHWVLNDISFSAKTSEIIHLKGINGSGKSTLLSIMTGQLPPSSGEILIDDVKLAPDNLPLINDIYLLPEKLVPSPWMSVEEYIEFALQIRLKTKVTSKETTDKPILTTDGPILEDDVGNIIPQIINKWQLQPFTNRPVGTLSQGENRRLLLAIALACKPSVLLLDEPTTGLDSSFRELLGKEIDSIKKETITIISSHIEKEGLPAFDRTIELESGTIISDSISKIGTDNN